MQSTHRDMPRAEDSAGWVASLDLELGVNNHRTRLLKAAHVGPLRVQKPYQQPDGSCHVYLLHPPGGLVGGDSLDINILAAKRADCLFTSPSAAKFYRCSTKRTPQTLVTRIRIEAAAHVEWVPQETIFYNGACAEITNHVTLEGNSTYLGWEIGCLGRRASGEDFSQGSLTQAASVVIDGTLRHKERVQFSPAQQNACWAFAGHSVFGTLVAVPLEERLTDLQVVISSLRGLLNGQRWGVTHRDRTIIVRYLGDSAEVCRHGFEAARCVLNEAGLFNRATHAYRPRIWNT